MRRYIIAGAVALGAVATAVPASANYYDAYGCYWVWSPYYGRMVRASCPQPYYAPYYQPYYAPYPYYQPYYSPGIYLNFGLGHRGYHSHRRH